MKVTMAKLLELPCQHPGRERRCGRPWDDEHHDPLGPRGRHVFDPYPPLAEDRG